MSYEPNDWSCGDVVTTEKLNAMERGIADMNSEYVPNVWASGDTITAEKLNHMEQGIANGGGGGSSDFSTATVQLKSESTGHSFFISSDYDSVTGLVPTEEGYFTDEAIEQIDVGVTYTLNVLVLNGSFMIALVDNGNISANSISTTGSATVRDLGGFVEIRVTGDCTITISEGE